MKKLLPAICLVFLPPQLHAQTYGVLETNNIRCAVNSRGHLFEVFPGNQIFEVPVGSGLSTVYSSNLWIGGISSDQELKLAAEMYFGEGHDWYPGPLTLGEATTTNTVMQQYDQVWIASAADVATHIAYFNAVANNTVEEEFPDGYTVPQWIINWPAHGDYTNGYDLYLAPFFDYDLDYVYNPFAGDYPLFCGDECIYFIFNDNGGEHSASGGQPIGLEIHGMLYAFDDADPMLQNTVFLKYRIINRGTQELNDAYMGMFTDFDIANPINDYVGTFVQNQAIYGYNGSTNTDEYDGPPPFQATQLLAGPWLDYDGADNPLPDSEYSSATLSYGPAGWGFGDGSIDNERAGISHSVSFENNFEPNWGMPETAVQHYNFLNGLSKAGAPQTFYQNPEANVSDYFAPGESHPLGPDDGLGIGLSWEEPLWGVPPGDRRMVGSFGPVSVSPGEVNFIDIAFVFQEGSEESLAVTSDNLNARLVESKNYFNEFLTDCDSTSPITHVTENHKTESLGIFPNPATTEIRIQHPGIGEASIYHSDGRLISRHMVRPGSQRIDIQHLAPGLYQISFAGTTERFIKL